MFLDDDIAKARPWFDRIIQGGRLALFAMLAATVLLIGIAADAQAETTAAPAAQTLATIDPMTTASTPVVAPLLTTSALRFPLLQTETLADRYILLGLMMLCFAAMTAGSLALWRSSLKELLRVQAKRHDA
ncbi:unnamed protein product [Ciceribacter sp. T2.26MG-112.2]|uniref:hypothetical protein n=1 Tax=Ciceribacter sp. T2.26MG-112.2 TaxID=3137154 RepID=UPI000E17ED18|nr:hypothetical protein [Ciceribacter naphthalenivorans]SSC71269.1 unnamed protein product [Ciceribacter naphthalenivorans]